jgi:predicted DNA-binding antitoxin AbrB/MazE fold protein
MNVQAVWSNGVFRPIEPLKIKHAVITIQVPDEEIAENETEPAALRQESCALPPEARAIADRMTAELDLIRNAPFPLDEEILPLSQKQLERIAAFATREER